MSEFQQLIEEQKRTTAALEKLSGVTGSNQEEIIQTQKEDTRTLEQIEKDITNLWVLIK